MGSEVENILFIIKYMSPTFKIYESGISLESELSSLKPWLRPNQILEKPKCEYQGINIYWKRSRL